MGSTTWITTILCPLIGVVLTNAMAIAPYKAVVDARKKKDLGELNPFPFALIMNSQLGWALYAVLSHDYFIFLSSCFPFMLGVILCMTAIHILERGVQHDTREKILRLRLEYVMFTSMCYWMLMVFLTCFVLNPAYPTLAILIVGISSDISSLLYYAAPLATIAEVIRTKDSSSLFVPVIVISAFNCTLWLFYGLFGVQSALIYIPNAICLLLCIVELIVRAIYPASSKSFEEKLAEATVEDLSSAAGEIANRVRTATMDFGTRIITTTEDFSTRVRTASDAITARVRRTSLSEHPEDLEQKDALIKSSDGYENMYPSFKENVIPDNDAGLELQYMKDNFD